MILLKKNLNFLRQEWQLALIICISVSIHLTIFLIFCNGGYKAIHGDAIQYITLAKPFLANQLFPSSPTQTIMGRTPGYPLFISFFSTFFKHPYIAIPIAQILMHPILILSIYAICKQIFHKTIARVAAFFIGFDYVLMAYHFFIIPESLYTLFIFLFLLITIKYLLYDITKPYYFIVAGLLLSIATLIRPISYYLILLFPIIFFFFYHNVQKKSLILTLRYLALFIAPCIILIGGWQLRNCELAKDCRFSLLTNAQFTRIYFPNNFRSYTNKIKLRGENIKRSQFNTKDSILMLITYPSLTIKEIGLGIIRLFNAIPGNLLFFFNKDRELKEYRKTKNLIKPYLLNLSLKSALDVLRHRPLDSAIMIYYSITGILKIFASLFICYGLWVSMRRKDYFKHFTKKQGQILLWICALYFIALSSNAISNSRLRLPFQPILDMYIAVGLVTFLRASMVRSKKIRLKAQKYLANENLHNDLENF